MTSKNKIVCLSIVLLIISIALSIPSTNWEVDTSVYSFAGVCAATISSIISLFIPSQYSKPFEISDWQPINGEYQLIILSKTHSMGKSPSSKVYKLTKGVYEQVLIDIHTNNNGDVEILGTKPFAGKVVIH